MLQAISGDAGFLRLIRAKTFNGRVHSVFGNALNLQDCADGNLYAVVAARFGNIPDALLIEDGAVSLIDAEVGTEVHAGDGLLMIGKTAIAVGQCQAWTAHLPLLAVSSDRLVARVNALETFLATHGKPGGMKAADDGGAFAEETARMLTEVSSGLVAALAAGNSDEVLTHAAGLIGLGPGLTPSGDDFLVGMLAALHCSPAGNLRDINRELGSFITERVATATNIISATALKNAAQGRFPETVIALMAALNEDDPRHLDRAATQVLAIGSSSGTDMLYGITAGLKVVAG